MQQEGPDFVLTFENGLKVGLEVVELADDRVAVGAAGVERLCGTLRKRLEARGISVHVHIRTGDDGFLPMLNSGAETRSHAAALGRLIEHHMAAGRPKTMYKLGEMRPFGVSLLREVIVEPDDFLWVTHGIQMRGRALSTVVTRVLEQKNALLPTYRENLRELPVWLLMLGGVRFASGVWTQSVRIADIVVAP